MTTSPVFQTLTPAQRRKLNPMQRRSINRIIRFFRQQESYNDVTSIRGELGGFGGRTTYFTIRTRRSDCDKYSMRAVVCQHEGHFAIGPRGKIRVLSTSTGISTPEHQAFYKQHVAKMLRATIAK